MLLILAACVLASAKLKDALLLRLLAEGNQSTFFCTAWCETTSYTSLLALGNDTFAVFCECPAAS